MDEQDQKLLRVFEAFDKDKSGTIELKELQQIFERIGVTIDSENVDVLIKRFDEDSNGKLSFDEFAEIFLNVMNMKKQFEFADADKSRSISAKEMTSVVQQLNLKISAKSIAPIMQLFDEDGSGTVDFQEYLALVFYFQELEYQYNYYCGNIKDYNWLTPLLGSENQANIPIVARKLQEWKSKKYTPSFDEFVDLIVKEAIAGNTDPTGRRKRGAPRITSIRKRIRAPKRGLKISQPAISQMVGDVTDRVKSASLAAGAALDDKGLWSDPNFLLGQAILPQSARQKIFQYKRPAEIHPNAQLFVEGVDEGDVIQGGLGDCWFLGALAVVATSTDNFIEHLFVHRDPKKGRYQCKFYKNGRWQLVDIDDKLPCNHSGRLFFASCRDTTEYWVPLVEKAYAKLHGSYDALEMGNIADGLKDLTGEAVEVLLLDDPSFQQRRDSLWKTLTHNIKESFLMGCSKEDSKAKAETQLNTGLLLNHAYSIIDCEEVQGHRLMRIRNPWGRGEWTGAWGDDSKEWTPALQKHFKYDFANDGTFFMAFEDFVANFNRIYVLRLMTDSEGEVWEKSVFHGEFKGESAGGCTNHASWPGNPQYSLVVKKPNTKVFLNLSQPDLRYENKANPAAHRKHYDPVGVVVMKTDQVRYKKTSYSQDERVATSLFCGMRDISLEFVAQPGQHIIMPCTFNPKIEFKFELAVYTEHKCDVNEVTASLPKKTVKSAWRGPSAGGCVNHPKTWLNNPQFLLTTAGKGAIIITLDQEISQQDAPECVGIYVFKVFNKVRVDRPVNPHLVPKTFLNVVSVSETLQAEAGAHYIVMPTTFDPIDRPFSLSVASPDTQITSFNQL